MFLSAIFALLIEPTPADLVLQQVREILRADFAAIALGIVITGIGLAALLVAAFYWRSRGALLSFGLFAGLYGIRLLVRTPAVHILFDLPPAAGEYTASAITDAILVPALAFYCEIVGKGWKESIRWLIWFFAVYGVAAISMDIARRSPGWAPDPANFLPILGPLTLLHGLIFRRLPLRMPDRPETRALTIGIVVFFLSVLNEHLVEERLVPWRAQPEAVGFLVFVCSLGYVAARRFFANQQQLLAVEREMAAARQIQSSILPRQVPRAEGLRIAVRYVPMASVAGDFYDFHPGNGRQLGVLVADTIGHGVPAALVASMIKVAFASQAPQASNPAALLAELNRLFCRLAEGQFITAGYLFLDLDRRTALYAGAGHPPMLWWRRATSTVEEWEENGVLLGFRPTATYSNLPLELRAGDRILLYTDGIPEATNPAGEFFGGERFRQFLATHTHLPPDDFADALLQELSKWAGTDRGRPQEDDLTLVVIDIES